MDKDKTVDLAAELRAKIGTPSREAMIALGMVAVECALLLGESKTRLAKALIEDDNTVEDARLAWLLAPVMARLT